MKDKTRFTLDMDPVFQRRLKVTAAVKGITMREYCLAAIQRELARDDEQGMTTLPFGHDALDRLAALQSEVFQGRTLRGDSAELIRQSRARRAS
ncbi:MAG: hypothetical protein HY678_05585 [Chloroflexi bacterium]|nr:hypothetical protein [Chloroflexota bacterium]